MSSSSPLGYLTLTPILTRETQTSPKPKASPNRNLLRLALTGILIPVILSIALSLPLALPNRNLDPWKNIPNSPNANDIANPNPNATPNLSKHTSPKSASASSPDTLAYEH